MNHSKDEMRSGVFFALSAYLLWGLLPLYWKQLDHIGAPEILANRIFWSMVFILIYLSLAGKLPDFIKETKRVFADRKKIAGLLLTTCFISLNWGLYIWSVNTGNMLASSFGYYINPLINIFFGYVILKERFDPLEKLSVFVAAAAVLYLTASSGHIPWLSLALAISFSLYGLIKKILGLDALYALAWETMLITPLTILFMLSLAVKGGGHFGLSSSGLLLLLSGPVTALPLILFGAGVNKIPLSMLAFAQYLGPTLSFLFGVFLYKEPFSRVQAVSFSLIWLSVAIYLYANLRRAKLQKSQEAS